MCYLVQTSWGNLKAVIQKLRRNLHRKLGSFEKAFCLVKEQEDTSNM